MQRLITYSLFIVYLTLISSSVFSQYKPGYTETGIASFYHNKFVGRKTATGEIFSQEKMTAAHKYLPLNCWVKVTNLSNDSTVILRINDRMPEWNKRSIDLTYAAAKKLNYINSGLTKVKIEMIPDPKKEEIDPKTKMSKDLSINKLEPRRTNLLHVQKKDPQLRFPYVYYFPVPEKLSFFKKLFSNLN